MKNKRETKIIDFTSLSDLFMLLSILFLIMFSVNSLKTGVVAIAERELAKKKIQEIQVKANLLKINAKEIEGQKSINKKINELGELEKKAAKIKNEQQKLLEIAIDREVNIKNYRELVENSLYSRKIMKQEMTKEKQAVEALQFQNDNLKKAIKNLSKSTIAKTKIIDKVKKKAYLNEFLLKEKILDTKEKDQAISEMIRKIKRENYKDKKQVKVLAQRHKKIKKLEGQRVELKNNVVKLNSLIAQLENKRKSLDQKLKIQKNKRIFQESVAKNRLQAVKSERSKLRGMQKVIKEKSRAIASINATNASLGMKLAEVNKKYLKNERLSRNSNIDVKTLGSKLRGAHRTIASLEKANSKLGGELSKTKASAQGSSNAVASLEKENANLMGYKRNYKGLLKENKNLNNKIVQVSKKENIKRNLIKRIMRSLSSHGVKGSINSQTGEVVLDQKLSFFEYGSSKINNQVKDLLENFIAAYSKGLFEDPALAANIKSVNFVGSASPTFNKKIITGENLNTRWGQRAISFNLDLSYRRARNIFNHLFNNPSVSFLYKEKMLPFIKVTGTGFLKSRFPSSVSNGGMDYCDKIECEKYQSVKIGFTLK